MSDFQQLLKTASKALTGNNSALVKGELDVPGIVGIKKADNDLQVVFGEVYAPSLFPDTQNDIASEEEIRRMAYGFMKASAMQKIDVGHSQQDCGAYVVESFIARENDPDFIPGSWVLGVWCPDAEWALVKSGELNGFSLDGFGIRVPTVITVEIPNLMKGETVETDGHTHTFVVNFDEEGKFLGGHTDPAPDGHFHLIKRGTVTEDVNGHSHRFSFVEGIINAQV